MRLASLLLALPLAACSGGSSSTTPDLGGPSPDLGPANALVIARPYNLDVPVAYDPAKPTPLVVLLHGYSANGLSQAGYFGLRPEVDKRGYLLAYPDGTKDAQGNHFWNATDACCDFGKTGVDDVAYLDAVIDDVIAHYNVDRKRVFVTGHSNGGFMSHRYACDRAGRVAAIVALAGDNWKDAEKCKPSETVAVLQVHGDMDESVIYDGEMGQPSAHDSVAGWAAKNGCAAMPTDTTQAPIDLERSLPGAETTKERWTGCKPGGAAELWTIKGGSHLPSWNQPAWPDALWGWFEAHPKP